MPPRDELDEVRTEVAVGNRVLAQLGLATGLRASLGHASMRLPSDPTKFVVKGRGYRMDILSRMRPEEMVTCDLEGNWVDGPPGSLQCGEVKIHSCIYKARPDIKSVVHVHPKFTVLMSVLGKPWRPLAQEGVGLFQKQPPVYPRTKVVTTEDEGQQVAKLLGDGRFVLLLGHGAVTTGNSIEQSVTMMGQLEHQAEYNYMAYAAAGRDHPYIPDELVKELLDAQVRGGYPEPHFAKRVAEVGPPRFTGIWRYYEELVSGDL
jgi:ribulose-5-phosphate 4-epimerase/fuculose-1-phosphate aldolase